MSERRARIKSVPSRFLLCVYVWRVLSCNPFCVALQELAVGRSGERVCVCLRAVDVPLCKPRSPSGEKKKAAAEIGLRAFLVAFASNERSNGTGWCLVCTNSSFFGFDFVDADSVDAYMFE